MITHPGARTRALYKWESEDLLNRTGAGSKINIWTAQTVRDFLWFKFANKRQMPSIRIAYWPNNEMSFCQGYSQITLYPDGHNLVVLTHEVVHALGYGSRGNVHSRGFILAYMKSLHIVLGWDHNELRTEAHRRGLL